MAAAIENLPFLNDKKMSSLDLVDALIGMNVLASSQGSSIEATARSIAFSSDVAGDESLDRESLAESLYSLLSIGPIKHLGKAFDLGTAYEKSMETLRIITDVRPIFEDDANLPPTSAVISHNLLLKTYGDAGEQSTTVVNMDAADLQRLLDQTQRALDKARTIRTVLGRLDVSIHDLEQQ